MAPKCATIRGACPHIKSRPCHKVNSEPSQLCSTFSKWDQQPFQDSWEHQPTIFMSTYYTPGTL